MKSVFEYGMVVGFLPNKPDFAIVTNGFFTIHAFVSGDRSKVLIGKKYAIYRQNSLYYVGGEVDL